MARCWGGGGARAISARVFYDLINCYSRNLAFFFHSVHLVKSNSYFANLVTQLLPQKRFGIVDRSLQLHWWQHRTKNIILHIKFQPGGGGKHNVPAEIMITSAHAL